MSPNDGSASRIPHPALGPTLCIPDAEKSCFACCPPIRPANYEHIQYQNSVKRMLRENTLTFGTREKRISPITGFGCWALGYLDKRYTLVGCMLHPAQNEGVDLRFRVDYGKKCQRESCPAASLFLELDVGERRFWLHLVDGIDAFAYSSKKTNPLFNMMGWGVDLLRLIAMNEYGRLFSRESFFRTYSFFSTRLKPQANAYLLCKIVRRENIHLLESESFRERFETFSGRISGQLRQISEQAPAAAPYTHLLRLDRDFLDFLRLSVGISKIDLEEALRLKEIVDRAVQEF